MLKCRNGDIYHKSKNGTITRLRPVVANGTTQFAIVSRTRPRRNNRPAMGERLIAWQSMYAIIQKASLADDVPNTYEKTKFLQNLVTRLRRLQTRHENGDIMPRTVVLDTDRIAVRDVLDILEKERASDENKRIVEKIKDELRR